MQQAAPAFWSAAPIVWNDPDRAAEKLRLLLQSNADFQSRIRMLSENLRLHEALEKLDANDVRVQAALAAAQANWHASRQAWPEAALAFDRLMAADPSRHRRPGCARPGCCAWRRPCSIRIGLPTRPGSCKTAQHARTRTGCRRFPEPRAWTTRPPRSRHRSGTALERRLADDPRNSGLLELRAELDRLKTDLARQVAECTAAIQVRTEETETGKAPSFDLRHLYRLRGDAYVGLKTVAKSRCRLRPCHHSRDDRRRPARKPGAGHEALKHHDAATADWTRAAAGRPRRKLARRAGATIGGGRPGPQGGRSL